MSKKRVDTFDAEKHLAKVEENNRQMREKANPLVRAMMDEVQAAIDHENAVMDDQFQAETRLRTWAKELLGFSVNISQVEELQRLIQETPKGKFFQYRGATLYKTQFDVVDRAERYLFALEKTVVDLMGKISPQPKYTDESFFGLIKLAFKRLFTRSK